jgi:hypothetical protein
MDRTLELATVQERIAAANERMMPAQERIAAAQQRIAESQLAMWHAQAPFRDRLNQLQLDQMQGEAQRIKDTFDTMYNQTRWAGYMLWITFLLGVALIVVSVIVYLVRPDDNGPLVGVFFGAGALSMLAFFLRDPAQNIQRAGGKLVQLQVALRYHLVEMQYWANYFNTKVALGQNVLAKELGDALKDMRDGMQTIMRQIDESMAQRATKDESAAPPRPRRRTPEHEPPPASHEDPPSG